MNSGAAVSMLLLVGAPLVLSAQGEGRTAPPPAADPPATVTIAAGPQYRAGGFRRFLLGDGYRDLWVTPIQVPVLDLETYGGGLKPLKSGGGMQTKSLRFSAHDGREYVFRVVDKDHSFTVPPSFKKTFLTGISRDQVSNLHPAGAIAAAHILDAAGVLHATPILVAMPDDPLLGEYRATYANQLGMIEEYPHKPAHSVGFAGAEEIIDSEELLKLLNTDPSQHIDARAMLTARLTDMLLGDWDRHQGQWKWAQAQKKPASPWVPIARDRDMVFVTYEGLMSKVAGFMMPVSTPFTGTYPNIHAQTWDTAEMDRRLLGGLDKATWDATAAELTQRITDSVIDAAIQAMPPEYRASEPSLASALKIRRSQLPAIADRFYNFVFEIADVHGTDVADRATIVRSGDGVVDVRLESADGLPVFNRRFNGNETKQIRVYLHGGDDTALVIGHVQHSISVRVIGGNGTNHIVDSSTVGGRGHMARLYDVGTVTGVSYGPDTMFNRRPWEEEDGKNLPPEADRGATYTPLFGISSHRGFGITPRVGLARTTYGFDSRPYASRRTLELEYAPDVNGLRVVTTMDERREDSPLHFIASARMSQLEMVGYHGLGNATADSGLLNSYFDVHQRLWTVRPAIALALNTATDLSLGPVVTYSTTDAPLNRFITTDQPYGTGSFGQAGVSLSLHHDTRTQSGDREKGTLRRIRYDVTGTAYPAVWDVKHAYEDVSATVAYSAEFPVGNHPSLVVRAGGRKLFGTFPFFQSAFIGGNGTLRFMDPQRYAGDAALFATSELRVPLVNFVMVLPLNAGLIGMAESGRVYVNGDSPGGWHSVAGGGFFIGLKEQGSLLSFAMTNEQGRPGLQVRTGLKF